MYTILSKLKERIVSLGGFVNAHSHLDRAGTVEYFTKEEQYRFLKEKWRLVDKVKRQSDYSIYKNRIDYALSSQLSHGVTSICSFIDIDDIASNRAILAASSVAKERSDIRLLTACQTLKGVLEHTQDLLLRNSFMHVDIIGSLPGADKGRGTLGQSYGLG